jgi:hypothetical protein
MITVYNSKLPAFKTAGEYYHAARTYESNPRGVPLHSPYLDHLWAKFAELSHFSKKPMVDHPDDCTGGF